MRNPRPCKCGSGKWDYDLTDARGIFCDYVCEDCEAKVRRKYRCEIFTNPEYITNEPIEPDYDYIEW